MTDVIISDIISSSVLLVGIVVSAVITVKVNRRKHRMEDLEEDNKNLKSELIRAYNEIKRCQNLELGIYSEIAGGAKSLDGTKIKFRKLLKKKGIDSPTFSPSKVDKRLHELI
jgi:hypothetical protein